MGRRRTRGQSASRAGGMSDEPTSGALGQGQMIGARASTIQAPIKLGPTPAASSPTRPEPTSLHRLIPPRLPSSAPVALRPARRAMRPARGPS